VIAAARVLDHGGIFDLMKEAIASTTSSNANIDFLQYRRPASAETPFRFDRNQQ